MKKTNPYLSVVIPVFNETRRLHNLRTAINFFKKQKFKTEIIVVNDGSTDDTLQKLEKMNLKNSFRLLTYEQNQGKGNALRDGMLAARGKFRLFMDVDLSTPLEEFYRFQPHLKNSEVIIATRKISKSKLLKRQPKLRETLGKGFTFLSQVLLQVDVSDFTCGFKCFSQKASDKIFPFLTINRWGFDSEVLFIAQKRGLNIIEVSVSWKNDPQTKVKFPQDIIRSLMDLVTIRVNDFLGKYNEH